MTIFFKEIITKLENDGIFELSRKELVDKAHTCSAWQDAFLFGEGRAKIDKELLKKEFCDIDIKK